MKELRLHEGELPEEIREAAELSLFNRQCHLRSQKNSALHSFYFVSGETALASIHFNIENSIAISLPHVPFGSVEFSKALRPETLSDFLEQVESRLLAINVRKIIIKNPPHIYSKEQLSLLNFVFLNKKYKVTHTVLTASIIVGQDSFRARIKANELRRLKKCERENFSFRELSIMDMEIVYDFIYDCRQERNQSLSMKREELRQTINFCNQDFFLFGVFAENEMIAASITVLVNKNVLYNFYPAYLHAYHAFSPTVMLIEGMYKWCQSKEITLLDLGSSVLEGHTNFSLLNFKLNVGGSLSMKLTFEKEWQ